MRGRGSGFAWLAICSLVCQLEIEVYKRVYVPKWAVAQVFITVIAIKMIVHKNALKIVALQQIHHRERLWIGQGKRSKPLLRIICTC